MLKHVFVIFAALVCVSCQTIDAVIPILTDEIKKEIAACEENGGSYTIGVGCKLPAPPEPPVDPPKPPEPPVDPPLPPEPPVDPPGGPDYEYGEHEYYEFANVASAGTVSFWLSGFDSINAPHDTESWIFMAMGRHAGGGEMNLQMEVNYNPGRRHVEIRLITQRFGDTRCLRLGQRWCEASDYIDSSQEPELDFQAGRRYYVEIEWDSRAAFMRITPEGGRTYLWAGNGAGVPVWGGFTGYDYVRVGNGVYVAKPGYKGLITISNPEFKAK